MAIDRPMHRPLAHRRRSDHGLDASRLAVAGDPVAATWPALAILAKQRGDITFVHQSLYYPVTDAAQDTTATGVRRRPT